MGPRWCLLLGALLLAACAGEPEPTATPDGPAGIVNPFADPARRAMRIELDLDAYRRVRGTWTGSVRNTFTTDDASSTFTAYFEADTLRLIEEDLDMGEIGRGTNVYYFEAPQSESGAGAALFYAVQDQRRVLSDPAEAARYDDIRLRLALDPSSRVSASEQTIDGIAEPIQAAQAEGIRRHAAALRDEAMEAARPML